ncbi:hypothetical protein [uncultured Kordia sp.]|uniref:hypothetical protein n=1 Tax=uncultured Kordia sp. TaxID=507699 RepID=UPI002632A1B7|nr:hypothetical protein [uncultured Kordia sp.]
MNTILKIEIGLLIVIALTFLNSCNANHKVNHPDKLYLISLGKQNDTLIIADTQEISKIMSFLNQGERSTSKFRFKYRIEYKLDTLYNKIGVNGNRFKFNRKTYISNENFEEHLDQIVQKKETEKEIYRDITELDAYIGFKLQSGQVLSNSDKALTYIQKDSINVLILEQIIRTDASKANFSILDTVVFINKDAATEIALTSCKLTENHKNELIFSFIKNENTDSYATILKSWIISVSKNVFQKIESKKVTCYNEHYGYDG